MHLEAGHVMLGPLLLFAILFADDLVLLARSVKDLQSLVNAFAKYCDKSHEQVAVDKIEAMVFHNANYPLLIVAVRNVNVLFVMASSAKGFPNMYTTRLS